MGGVAGQGEAAGMGGVAGQGGEAGMGGVAGQGGAAGYSPADLVSLVGTVYSNEDLSKIGGATLTIEAGFSPTTTTADGNGAYSLEVLPQASLFFRAEAEGYYPMLRGLIVPETGATRDWYLPATTSFEGAFQLTGETQDPTKGLVWVSFENATVGGYTAKLSAAHGISITGDPATMLPTKGEVTLSGGQGFWFLVFDNVDVGMTTVDITAPDGHSCKPRTSLADWRVDASVITYIDLDCN
jgi:hypothetical protein